MPGLRAPRRLRTTFAFKLLVAGLAMSVVLIGSVSVFLFLSRDQQTRTAAVSNAANRAALLRQLIQRVSVPQARAGAEDVASLHEIQAALATPDPGPTVRSLFAAGGAAHGLLLADNGDFVIVFDRNGKVIYTDEPGQAPPVTATLTTVQAALSGCGTEGTEIIGPLDAAYDISVSVNDASTPAQAAGKTCVPSKAHVLGAVVYTSPLSLQLALFAPAATYPTAFIPADGSNTIFRVTLDKGGNATVKKQPLPTSLIGATPDSQGTISSVYSTPTGDVAGDFVSLSAPGDNTAGYIGVELPLSDFAASESNDKWTVVLIGLTAIAVTALFVVMFVSRFVRRPVRTLQRGVARIASGDYTTDIPVVSEDELGDLARSVNRMRLQIASYIRHIDGSVARLSEVSRALTTTAAGVETLQRAVLTAAVGMVGGEATTALFQLTDGRLTRAAVYPAEGAIAELSDERAAALLAGEHLHWVEAGGHVLVLPMYYQQQVVGALLAATPKEAQESDERSLVALANNATIALQNTRLYEQEKETVARLRELDVMKSDFLSNVQHELRTPVMAIMGQIELMTVAWDKWDEATKLELMKDMEIYTRQLKQIVDVMIDFSLFSSETLQLKKAPVNVRQSVDAVLAEIADGFKGKLPVNVQVNIANDIFIDADQARFAQVIQALLDNSVKFTKPGGHIAVRAAVQGNVAKIVVQDDGIGIPEDALPRIFEQFYQADSSKTRTFGGLGMGLALVDRLTEAHGAQVEVASTVGEGSIFSVSWPLAKPATAVTAGGGDSFHVVDPGTSMS